MAQLRHGNEASLIRDAAERARALRESLGRDGASVSDYEDWPEGPALYDETIAALDRVMHEVNAQEQPMTTDVPAIPSEGAR